MPFSEMTSAISDSPHRCDMRLDPYYDGMWTQGSSALWVSKELADTQVRAGLARMPKSLDMEEDDARRCVRSSRLFGARVAALGALDQWRTLSSEQLAAFTGWGQLASKNPKSMVSLFTLGVVDRGSYASALLPGSNTDRATLYRPSRSGAFDQEIAPILSYEQQLAVSGGRPWDFRRQYDRHNVIAAELGLRVAEYCDVGTVVGEKLSTADMLMGTGAGNREITDDRAADLTIVRRDGMRIAIEMTASAGPDFKDKVRKWAKLMSRKSFDATGLMVVFVEAAPHDGGFRFGTGPAVRSQVYKAVASVVREFPGSAADRIANRFGVVAWSQWFPQRGHGSQEFEFLEVERPTGPANDRWERASLLDEFTIPFNPVDPAMSRAIIDNAGMLYGTPWWLREDTDTPDTWPKLINRVGWSELPVPPVSRESRVNPVRSDAVRGVVGATRVAARSRFGIADPPYDRAHGNIKPRARHLMVVPDQPPAVVAEQPVATAGVPPATGHAPVIVPLAQLLAQRRAQSSGSPS